MNRLRFQIEKTQPGTAARAGRFQTLHNEVLTPLFMPVGTQATVKAQTVESLEAAGSQILLANTYHLLLRPGPEVFRKLGGIQKFMSWRRSVLTDSGGFQIFSLHRSRVMNEEGARFQSYVDNRWLMLTPELSIETQKAIGSDIMMVLDQCVPSTVDRGTARSAMELTHRWAHRSFAARGDSPQSLFGIVQGACFPDLRRESALTLREIPFDGFAIGGLAVGEGKTEREDIAGHTLQFVPADRPRYLMGVGTPLDILEAVHLGVDMFDCIIPTSFALRGTVFTSEGKLQIRRVAYRHSDEPLDRECGCPTCRRFSRAYLHHLTKTEEVYGWQLLGVHNIWFYHRFMEAIRQSLFDQKFLDFYRSQRDAQSRGDGESPPRRERKPVEDPRLFDESSLESRLFANAGTELVVWDLGLGTAAHAMAAIRGYENLREKQARKIAMHLVSFAEDLTPFAQAVEAGEREELSHPGVDGILETGRWESKGLRWQLRHGAIEQELADAPRPDLIFCDPAKALSASAVKLVCDHCRDRDVELFTGSDQAALLAALKEAGFELVSGTRPEVALALTPRAVGRREASYGANTKV